MSLYAAYVPHALQMLTNVGRWLAEARAFADERGFDADTLLHARLAPDQFDLCRQLQTVADTAKLTAARLAGIEAPSHADDETTLAELEARLAEVRALVADVSAEQVDGRAEELVALPFMKGMGMTGRDYVAVFALPNFYFHVSMVYAILRHNGVPLGKRAFLGAEGFEAAVRPLG